MRWSVGKLESGEIAIVIDNGDTVAVLPAQFLEQAERAVKRHNERLLDLIFVSAAFVDTSGRIKTNQKIGSFESFEDRQKVVELLDTDTKKLGTIIPSSIIVTEFRNVQATPKTVETMPWRVK